MSQANDVRAVLQYVPQFRGKIFLVLIQAGILPEHAVAESLLDLAALEDLGVKLVLGVLDGDLQDLYDWTLECEMMAAKVAVPLTDKQALQSTKDILTRGQSAIIDASCSSSLLHASIIDFAKQLKASKIIALIDHEISLPHGAAHAIQTQDALAIAANLENHMSQALLQFAAEACSNGIPRVHLLNGKRQGVLVEELFSNEGVGAMVYGDNYQLIRPLREEDIPELLGMIGRSVRRTTLLARNYEDILDRIHDYYVMTIDDNVVGCIAMHEYSDCNQAEIACLYVKQAHEGRGYGMALVLYIEELARSKNISRLFALTNRAADFFHHRLHFNKAEMDVLPPKRLEYYLINGRNSEVFIKDLYPPT